MSESTASDVQIERGGRAIKLLGIGVFILLQIATWGIYLVLSLPPENRSFFGLGFVTFASVVELLALGLILASVTPKGTGLQAGGLVKTNLMISLGGYALVGFITLAIYAIARESNREEWIRQATLSGWDLKFAIIMFLEGLLFSALALGFVAMDFLGQKSTLAKAEFGGKGTPNAVMLATILHRLKGHAWGDETAATHADRLVRKLNAIETQLRNNSLISSEGQVAFQEFIVDLRRSVDGALASANPAACTEHLASAEAHAATASSIFLLHA